MKKLITLSLIIICLTCVFSFSLADNRPLEINYPEVPGLDAVPITVEGTDLGFYVKYLFNFSIGIIGFIGFGVLLVGGIKYLTSAGNLLMMKSAKDQIRSAFLGILLLLFSYIILTTINPQLVIFETPDIQDITSEPINITFEYFDTLGRIRNITEQIESLSNEIIINGGSLKALVDTCRCGISNSECDCLYLCTAVRCYGDPCASVRDSIEKLQLDIIEKKDEINFYRMLLKSEMKDLLPELQALSTTSAERIMDEEGNGLLKDLCDLVKPDGGGGIVLETENLLKLPNECNLNSCTPTCDVNSNCHIDCSFDPETGDVAGCKPDICKGGNPCPVVEINNVLQIINKYHNNISSKKIDIINTLKSR
ncbi:hypothetical protein ACFLYY_00500 [Patescibacteria group bacterium]